MVRNIANPALTAQIDETLDYLLAQWEEVPEASALWDSEFDDVAREVYQLEWTIPRDRFDELQDWFNHGFLTSPQRARYEQLLTLIDRTKPTLDRMFAES